MYHLYNRIKKTVRHFGNFNKYIKNIYASKDEKNCKIMTKSFFFFFFKSHYLAKKMKRFETYY